MIFMEPSIEHWFIGTPPLPDLLGRALNSKQTLSDILKSRG